MNFSLNLKILVSYFFYSNHVQGQQLVKTEYGLHDHFAEKVSLLMNEFGVESRRCAFLQCLFEFVIAALVDVYAELIDFVYSNVDSLPERFDYDARVNSLFDKLFDLLQKFPS